MPLLPHAKHELFAQLIAKGDFITDAHEKAGYKRHDSNASKLALKPEISARVAEIIGKAAKNVGITIERVLAELGKIGFSGMTDYVTIGQDGLPFVDWTNITPDQMAAIREVTIETRNEVGKDEEGRKELVPVRKVKFSLHDKRAALVDIGKHLGMFVERHEHGGVGDFSRMSDDDLVKEIREATAEIGISRTEH